jgi:hypothetical protein
MSDTPAFDQFCQRWPGGVRFRGPTLAAWLAVVDNPETAALILAAVERERDRWLAEGLPSAPVWLRRKGWTRPGAPAAEFLGPRPADRRRWNRRGPGLDRGG